MAKTIQAAVSTFGTSAKQELANLVASGEPEDPLRTAGALAAQVAGKAKAAADGEPNLFPNH